MGELISFETGKILDPGNKLSRQNLIEETARLVARIRTTPSEDQQTIIQMMGVLKDRLSEFDPDLTSAESDEIYNGAAKIEREQQTKLKEV
jgi:hypothetical protein